MWWWVIASVATASYTCQCPPGFTSAECGTNIDDCTSSPCEHSTDLTCTCITPEEDISSQLDGLTLGPGCYNNHETALDLSADATFTLSGYGKYTFTTDAAVTTGANSNIRLINGAACGDINWCVVTVTTGANSIFNGNIQAGVITLGDGSTVYGEQSVTPSFGIGASVIACSNVSAICVDGIDSYICTCEPGYTGDACQDQIR